ncbi:MAG: 50S ribosomal protein L29 [Bacteroidia bacterium]|jgi:large subunit ribosomal protein L29|nr:50S ribosomal protein L29 [Bacteroidota bacterium]MBP7245225.1 50S ribosomal protein L29 [Bacteroidia bacterium]
MKQSIVKDLTTDEVRAKIGEERTSYTKMKMAHAVSPIENPMKIRASRRAIARLMTELRKRLSQTPSAEK